jgi:hypothetical protein
MIVLAATAALLASCAGGPPPEPRIVVKEVRIPVPVPCAADPGPAPAYPDSAQALRAAPDLFARAQLLLAGRALREADLAAARAALKACAGSLAPELLIGKEIDLRPNHQAGLF